MNLETIKRSIHESEAVIKSNESLVGMGIWNIGNELKAIRDNKTYKEKGYSNFQEYAKSELEYSRSHCYRFIEVVENYSVPSMGQISNLGITKLLSLSALPQEERDDFIADTHEVNGEDKTVADMTTRELEKVIKEKKQLQEQMESYKHQQDILLEENKELKNQKPVEVEREVVPDDYNYYKNATHKLQGTVSELSRESADNKIKLSKLEGEKSLLERKVKLNEEDSNKYKQLKSQIENLSKQKDDLGRRIKSVTELSGLVVRIEHTLKTELAPIKYSRAIREVSTDEMVTRNLKEIIDRVQDWCNEMYKYTKDENIIDSEVIDHE